MYEKNELPMTELFANNDDDTGDSAVAPMERLCSKSREENIEELAQ
jgi:hypothetical protein